MVPQEDFHHLSLNDQVLGSLGSLEPGSLGASQLLQLMRLTRIFSYLPTTPHVVSASRGPQGLHLAIMGRSKDHRRKYGETKYIYE